MRAGLVISIAVVAGLLGGQPALAGDEPIVLAPSSGWVMDYADDSCALRREFGGPDNPVVLQLQQFAPGKSDIQFHVVARELGWLRVRGPLQASATWLPDVDPFPTIGEYKITTPDEWRGIIFSGSVSSDSADLGGGEPNSTGEQVRPVAVSQREAGITGLRIANAFSEEIVLQTGGLRSPMAAMRTCLDELLAHWGIDVEAHRTLSRPLQMLNQNDVARVFLHEYPRRMVLQSQEAVLRVRLMVSPEGRVTGCHMQQRIGREAFEQSACEMLQTQARYQPALDAHGAPIASFHVLAIYFDIS
jgi:TonB family protein